MLKLFYKLFSSCDDIKRARVVSVINDRYVIDLDAFELYNLIDYMIDWDLYSSVVVIDGIVDKNVDEIIDEIIKYYRLVDNDMLVVSVRSDDDADAPDTTLHTLNPSTQSNTSKIYLLYNFK